MATLIDNIIADLSIELSKDDDEFKAGVLTAKVNQAYREVKTARKYPSHYTSTMITSDMENYYSNIRNIALYDYNQYGGEFEISHNEKNISREWVNRNDLFNGIYPLSKF